MKVYKPENYNSLSPYLIVDEARKLVDLLKIVFNATILRRFDHENGTIAHIELQIEDSVLMISNSTENYKAHTSMLHVYVPNAMETYQKAIDQGCQSIEVPIRKEGDPDLRGSFYDFAGNYWAIGTQQ